MPAARLTGRRACGHLIRATNCGFQVTPNPLPVLLSAPGWALGAPDELIMVSSSSV
jgi:hypothetical protein